MVAYAEPCGVLGPPAGTLDELLSFRQPENTYNMADLGIDSPDALNDYAVCSPFQLLSAKAVSALRAELDSDAVQASCKYSNARTPCTLRGVSRHCPTLKALWASQEVTDIVSKVAGLPLVPVMDYELGVCNVQVHDDRGEDALVDDWHKDSYPVVAIVMLSDPSGVVGGETAIQRGDGSVLPIAFPTAGSCVVLQGQHVTHCGRRASSAKGERITMVTSYVPADPLLPDRSVLRGPRPVSDCGQLYHEWARYRLASLAAQATMRIAALDAMPDRRLGDGDMQDVRGWMDSMEAFIRATRAELI